MQPTVQLLLETRSLELRLLAGGSPERMSAPVSWIHSSDLADPTPFLDAGQVVLTTGTQFDPATATAEDVAAYVERLSAHGLLGIGFGTEVIREGTPHDLITACERFGMPLFEVPYRIPFIAVIRTAADVIAEAAHARDTWALNAQRAISFAALRPDAPSAILKELSRQLGRWVGFVDARGTLSPVFDETAAAPGLGDTARDRIVLEAERLIGRGQRSSSTIDDDAGRITLQTLGRRGAIRGVLATAGSSPLDASDKTVVTSVIALTGLALEQNRELARARGRLRSGLFQTLLEGNVDLVRRIVRQMGGHLPAEPVGFVVFEPTTAVRDALFGDLEARDAEFAGDLFFAASDDRVVVAASADGSAELAAELSRLHAVPAGVSDPLHWAQTATGVSQATQALNRAMREFAAGQGSTPGEAVASVTVFSEVAERGLAALLPRADAAEIAQALLKPVLEHDAENGTELLDDVRTWLEHHGQWDPAARALGIHRHTLKNRVALVERLVGRSLATVDARTNLWLALQLR